MQASRRDAGPAPVGRFAAPVKAQSTRKKYWRKLVSDDLAPRDAPLKFVWPNPKAHLTSKSGRKTAIAYEAYSRPPRPSRSSSRSAGGPTTWPTTWLEGFVVVTDMVDGPPPPKKARGAAARAAAAAAAAPPPPPVVKEEVAAVVTAPEDDKGPTVADLAAYLVSRGGTATQVDGWSVGKNPRGDTIFTDPNFGPRLPVEARGGSLPERGPGLDRTPIPVHTGIPVGRARRSAPRRAVSSHAGYPPAYAVAEHASVA